MSSFFGFGSAAAGLSGMLAGSSSGTGKAAFLSSNSTLTPSQAPDLKAELAKGTPLLGGRGGGRSDTTSPEAMQYVRTPASALHVANAEDAPTAARDPKGNPAEEVVENAAVVAEESERAEVDEDGQGEADVDAEALTYPDTDEQYVSITGAMLGTLNELNEYGTSSISSLFMKKKTHCDKTERMKGQIGAESDRKRKFISTLAEQAHAKYQKLQKIAKRVYATPKSAYQAGLAKGAAAAAGGDVDVSGFTDLAEAGEVEGGQEAEEEEAAAETAEELDDEEAAAETAEELDDEADGAVAEGGSEQAGEADEGGKQANESVDYAKLATQAM